MSDKREIAKPASHKVLLVAQYWDGDRTQMKVLLKLLADLEPGMCNIADLLLVNRFDSEPMESSVIKYLARKFHVFTYTAARRGTGWPCGCNSLAFSSVEWFYRMSAEVKGMPRYKAAFMMESDCCPLSRNWLRILLSQWDAFKGRICVGGCQVEGNGIARHINGNCFLSGNLKFLHWLGCRVNENNVGWDYCLADDFRKWGAANMPGIAFRWRMNSASDEVLTQLRDSGAVWLHGCKNYDALSYARRTLL